YNAPTNNALTPAVNGNTFTYNITDFSNLTPQSFGLQFITDTTAQANDQICVHVEINPTPLDADTTNNVYDFCYQVVNSYDPNMKEVYPVNVLPGYDDWFTYTIHFQNTGNAPAFNIRLRDTLDANLDINTFEIRGYSHPAIVSINGNILTVRFNNIMLPDSTTDYEGSMGYFQYRIKPLSNLPLGTQIENTAYIYFDYNAPIITNTTQNSFQLVTDLKSIDAKESNFVIYPNPSSGIYFFKDNRNLQSIEVYNMMGELILSQGNAKQINLQAFPKGIYVARINGACVKRLVKE
ncbi:MAG: T9SS type A sorting domain-containing protein, partial [Bacteroidota bacterium]